jgi:hypothetical protein
MKENKHEVVKEISKWYDEGSLLLTKFRRLYSKLRDLNPEKDNRNLLVTSATL